MTDDRFLEEGRTARFVNFWLGRRPDLDPEALALQLTIARINILARRTLKRIAESEGITPTDFQIMGAIRRGAQGGPIRPSDLWKLFSLTPGAITYRINRLFEMGLVERDALEADRRVILLRLTPDGEAKVDAVMTGYAGVLGDKLSSVQSTPEAREQLIALLRNLASAWEADEGDDVEEDLVEP